MKRMNFFIIIFEKTDVGKNKQDETVDIKRIEVMFLAIVIDMFQNDVKGNDKNNSKRQRNVMDERKIENIVNLNKKLFFFANCVKV